MAVGDHRHKRQVEFAAQEDAWFCARGRLESCRDFDEAAYEQRRENREFADRFLFFACSASAVGLGPVAVRRRHEATVQ